MIRTKISFLVAGVLLLFIWGCSTTNHAILPTQAFLDITSHYNAYFNSNEKLKTTLKNAETAHKEKFDSVLSVYYYNDAKEFASYNGDLEDVVKRSTQAVQLRGAANWSDDHFLLIGIANYLKGDYDKASASFKYITTEYKEGVDYIKVMKSLGKKPGKYVKAKKKKKKPEVKIIVNKDGTQTLEKIDKRPKFSLWVHEPARSEALIWLIKTYTRQKKYDEAQTVLTYVRGDDMFYQNLDPQLDLAEADLQVSRKNYSAAIEPLEKYLKAKGVKHRKRLKVRPLFVLAQCYAETGNSGKAIENYKQVLKSRPNYDMEFYAKIKMAKLGRSAGGNAAMRSLLAKMAKDGKYKEYWDQIYYELALLSISENNKAEARKFLHKSVDNSVSNDDQKSLSFLKLAELDYEDEVYVNAKFFYDSTLVFMAKNDERYADIDERDKLLDNLVKQLNIIAQEDSLQQLAALPEAERAKKIREAIARKEKEEEDKKAAEEEAKQQGVNNSNNNNQNNTVVQQTQNPSGITWYFYNSTVRANGYNDFIRKWGRRKLEENWRRKNKSSAIIDDDNLAASADSVATKDDTKTVKPGTPEEQMADNIPTTTEKMDASVVKITDAYYTAGTIYKDGLESYGNAIKMFETLNAKYPKNKLLLESYYNLYLIALKQNNTDRAAYYKNLILEQFPESVIAKVLRNPSYINEAKKQEQAVDDYYQLAYADYKRDSLDACWYKCEMADNMFKPNPLSAKFELLNALVLAKRNRLSDYVQALNKIINKTKDAEVKQAATDLLANLNKSSLPQIDLSKDSTRRDSLNSIFAKPDTALSEVQKQLNEAKEQAKKNGAVVQVDTTTPKQPIENNTQQTQNSQSINPADSASKKPVVETPVITEDTTSPYVRSDAAVHYFVIYIKDPATPQSAVMSTMAKMDAFNSSVMPEKKLVSKQVMIDSKNKLINVRQFKSRDDVMAYYKMVKNQSQLFNDLQPAQYAISCISTINFSTLLSEKDIDLYNSKFFNRVYK